MKKCCSCGKVMDDDNFHRNSGRKSGLSETCKPCAISRSSNWYRKNKDKKRAYDAKRRDEKRQLYREASKRWRDNNKASKRADTGLRRRRHRQRTPSWADLGAIKFFYECCPKGCHVDHVIPLNGKNVSGLHVAENLQWLPAKKNLEKGNRIA